jgi:hypothetical protein
MAYGKGGHAPADVPRYLKGIEFPASRMDLIHHARQHHADPEMIRKLEEFPEEEYASMDQVLEKYTEH